MFWLVIFIKRMVFKLLILLMSHIYGCEIAMIRKTNIHEDLNGVFHMTFKKQIIYK